MAITTTGTTLVQGTRAKKHVMYTFKDTTLVSGGFVYTHQTKANNFEIPLFDISGVGLQAYNPRGGSAKNVNWDFAPQPVEIKKMEVVAEYLPAELEANWSDKITSDVMLIQDAADELKGDMINLFLDRVNSNIGEALLTYSSAESAANFDGIVTIAESKTGVKKVEATEAIDASNVVAKFDALRNAMLADKKGRKAYFKSKFKFFTSEAVLAAFHDAQTSQANKGVDFTQSGVDKYRGKDIVVLEGMPEDTILGGVADSSDITSSFHLVIKNFGDDVFIKEGLSENDGEYRFLKMAFGMGMTIINPEGVCLYKYNEVAP